MIKSKNGMLIVMMLLAMTAWGGSWTSAKILAGIAQPEVLAFWRFLITSVTFIPIMLMMKKSFRLNRKSALFAFFGAICIVSYNEGLFFGLRYGLAGGGGVLVTTLNPILTFMFAAIVFKHSLKIKDILGLLIGFSGGAILLELWTVSPEKLLLSGNLYFLICASSWAALTLITQRSRENMSPIVFSFYVYTFAAVIDFFLAFPYGIMKPVGGGLIFWGNIAYMSAGATTFATTVYFIASTRMGSEKASSFIFTIPLSAVLVAWILLGEIPSLNLIIGGIVSTSAVYILNAKSFHTAIANGGGK